MLHFSRWKTILIWCAVAASMLIALPNLFSAAQLASLPSWIAGSKVELGLDLQGGSDILLKVERDDVIAQRLEDTVSDIRTRLRTVNVGHTGLTGSGQAISVHIPSPGQVQAANGGISAACRKCQQRYIERYLPGSNSDRWTRRADYRQPDRSGIDRRISLAIKRSIDVIRRRVVDVAKDTPSIKRQGADRLVVQEPGLTDPQLLKSLLNQKAGLSFRLIDESVPVQQAIDGQMPATSQVLYSEDDPPVAYLVQRQPMLSNVDIADAQATVEPQNDSGTVTIKLNEEATGRFARSTQSNIGSRSRSSLDDQIIATVALTTAIPNGSVDIAGFSPPRARRILPSCCALGPLPATLTAVEERHNPAGFGSETMRSGVVACIAAGIFVAALMVGFYACFGVGRTLAMAIKHRDGPGDHGDTWHGADLARLAAIVLIIGHLARRKRSDLRARQGRREEDAFSSRRVETRLCESSEDRHRCQSYCADRCNHSFLCQQGCGARFLLRRSSLASSRHSLPPAWSRARSWISGFRRRKPRTLLVGVRSGIFDGSRIRFMGIRRYTFTASAILSLATLLAIATVGMHLGIDFTGGSIIEVRAKQGVADATDIESRLEQTEFGCGAGRQYAKSFKRAYSRSCAEWWRKRRAIAVTLVRDELAADYDFSRVEVVGPSVSGEIAKTATFGILAALLAVFAYIWLRFAWQFAVGAIVAILHDIILTLGLFVLTGMEFNLISVAALLTIVGYSLNDTIVVYDRMRENLERYPQMPMPMPDRRIHQPDTLTHGPDLGNHLSGAVALFIFGGEVIRSLRLAMLFGVANRHVLLDLYWPPGFSSSSSFARTARRPARRNVPIATPKSIASVKERMTSHRR